MLAVSESRHERKGIDKRNDADLRVGFGEGKDFAQSYCIFTRDLLKHAEFHTGAWDLLLLSANRQFRTGNQAHWRSSVHFWGGRANSRFE